MAFPIQENIQSRKYSGIEFENDLRYEVKLARRELAIEKEKNRLKQDLIDNIIRCSTNTDKNVLKGREVFFVIIGTPSSGLNNFIKDFERRFRFVKKVNLNTTETPHDTLMRAGIGVTDYLFVFYSCGSQKTERSNSFSFGNSKDLKITLDDLVRNLNRWNSLYILDSNLATESIKFESYLEYQVAMLLANDHQSERQIKNPSGQGDMIASLTNFLEQYNLNIPAPLLFNLFVEHFKATVGDSVNQAPYFWCSKNFHMTIPKYVERKL